MDILTNVVIGVVAALHVYFLVLEMFLWDKPTGLRVFGHSLEAAWASKVLAMNQGLYNGFLAANRKILLVQALPAVIAMLLVVI